MANKTYKKIIAKAAGFALMVGTLVGALAFSAPTSVVHAADTPLPATNWVAGGSYSWEMASGIADPVATTNDGKTYYTPSAYIYYGSKYNAETGRYEPVLNRVLDADADNTGTAGSMFLLTENAIEAMAWYSGTLDGAAISSEQMAVENIYDYNFIGMTADFYSGTIFGNAFVSTENGDFGYLRPITKTDKEADMAGLFNNHDGCTDLGCTQCFIKGTSMYYFETDKSYYGTDNDRWYASHNSYYLQYEEGTPSTEAENLNGDKYFLLSIEEVNDYIGNYHGADGLAATNMQGEKVTWVTRTGLGESYPSDPLNNDVNAGNFVAGIDANGNVIPVSVDDATAYTRLGFNVDTSEVVYSNLVEGNNYQLAFTHPDYNAEYQFTADILGTKDNVVTLEYNNTYAQRIREGWNAYITVMIERDDAVLHYSNVCEAIPSASYNQRVQFTLPEGYEYVDTDTIKVFWEYKPADNQGVSYVSNLVEVDCLHTYTDTLTCSEYPTCTVSGCGEELPLLDPDHHTAYTAWEQGEKNGRHAHWRFCTACDSEKKHQLDLDYCNVEFHNCVGQCATCGRTVVDPGRCNFDENGFCTYVHTHYEPPSYVVQSDNTVKVIIENEGQWNYHADLVNNARAQQREDGSFLFYPGRRSVIVLADDLDFAGYDFISMGRYTDDTTASYVTGELICDGGDTISGIDHHSSEVSTGLFGYAQDFTVRGLTLTESYFSGQNNVGLIGWGQNVTVRDVEITKSSFSGQANVGAVIGRADKAEISRTIVRLVENSDNTVANVTVSAADPATAGAFIGLVTLLDGSDGPSAIQFGCLAMGVLDAGGNHLPFVPTLTAADGATVVTVDERSYCLYDTDCASDAVWDGTASAATFAGGKVAYMLQSINGGWSQIVDKQEYNKDMNRYEDMTPDPLPRYIPLNQDGRRTETVHRVYHVTYCDGNTSGKYTNRATRDYTVHKPAEVLEWKWTDQTCDAHVHCELCGADVWMDTHVELDYTYVPVRGDYTAYLLDPSGNKYVNEATGEVFSDTIVIIGIRIESMIGMTNVVMDYDGNGLYPEDLMNNHRLNEGDIPVDKEYEVWFLNAETGERVTTKGWRFDTEIWQDVWTDVPASAVNVGTYHLLVIGKNDYSDQEYVFENVLVINPIVVEIEPADVYKYYDGTVTFTPSYRITDPELADRFGGNYVGEYFTVEFSDASSSAEGRYTLSVTVDSRLDDDNIRFVLTRDTVQGTILPRLFVELENKNFPTDFTYGDTIPTPTADHFTFTEGSTLAFEWYKADLKKETFEDPVTREPVDRIEVLSRTRMDGQPRDAGDYILRVRASGVGTLAARFIDVIVTIEQANTLGIVLDTEGLEIYNDGYNDYYVVEMGQFPNGLPYEVTGLLAGDTMESAGIRVEIDYRQAEASPSPPGDSEKFPYQPYHYNYEVTYSVRCRDRFGNSGNYADAGRYLRVMVVVGDAAKPIPNVHLTDGAAKEIGVALTWPAMEGADSYTVKVTDPDGNPSEDIIRTVAPNEHDWNYDIRFGNIFANYTLTRAGTYAITVTSGETTVSEFSFTVEILHESGESLDQIEDDLGRYTVTVTQDDKVASADIYVKREIVMVAKEIEIDLDKNIPDFDIKKIVMEAGKVIMLGHELVDVQMSVNANRGSIEVDSFRVVDAQGNDVTHYYELNNVVYSWRHNDADLNPHFRNVAHIFDNACDSTCNISGCAYTRVTFHTGGTATCTSQAICEHCHTPYGEFSTTNHADTATHIAPNGMDRETHLLIHSCCGMTKEVLEHVEGTPATCISYAVCADCGWEYGELNPDNHAEDGFAYAYADDHGHTATHTCCRVVKTEAHSGGTATCTAEAECELCLHTYGKKDPDNHTGTATGTPDPNDPTMHSETYDCCQATQTSRHRGGVETCLSPAVCTVCRAEYGAKDPHNHTSAELVYTVRAENASMHDVTHACCGAFLRKEYHSGGTATCVSAALCQHCGHEYGLEDNASNHESEEVIYRIDTGREGMHIAVHACCGREIARESHSGGTATCQSGPLCQHCGAEYGEPHAHEFDNACDSICNLCEKQVRALVFHVDNDQNHVCDECQTTLESGEGVTAGSANTEEISNSILDEKKIKVSAVAASYAILPPRGSKEELEEARIF